MMQKRYAYPDTMINALQTICRNRSIRKFSLAIDKNYQAQKDLNSQQVFMKLNALAMKEPKRNLCMFIENGEAFLTSFASDNSFEEYRENIEKLFLKRRWTNEEIYVVNLSTLERVVWVNTTSSTILRRMTTLDTHLPKGLQPEFEFLRQTMAKMVFGRLD